MDTKTAGLWPPPSEAVTAKPTGIGRKSSPPLLSRAKLLLVFALAVVLTVTVHLPPPFKHQQQRTSPAADRSTSQCPNQVVIEPKLHPEITERNIVKLFPSRQFHNLSIKRLQGAVQIPTISYDDNGKIGEDPRWDVFYDLEKYFRDTFPLLHKKLELEVINVHNLVYTWRGSDPSLRPILLTGHQDVVPIPEDTLPEWTYPPFSGYFDGTYINGRGAHDCKNNVVAILSSITALLEAGFTPRRTVILGFGIDEESPSQLVGAYHIARHLERVWTKQPSSSSPSYPFAMHLDEGLIGITKMYNRTFGIPQAAEKGMLDARIRVHVAGGHSSTPPAHTSIGMLSQAVMALEDSYRANFRSRFTARNPFYHQLHCAAEDAHANLSSTLRDALLHESGPPDHDHPRITHLLSADPAADIFLHTTQAVTIFHAGDKANAIPAHASMLINYRISIDEDIGFVQDAIVSTIRPVARRLGLDLIVREEEDSSPTTTPPLNALSISWWRRIEPAPVSAHTSATWTHLSGAIKHVFDEPGPGNDVVVAPSLAVGNTDTKYFWRLSDQIYRFGPLRSWHDRGWGGIHAVNERIALAAHIESITFYHELIRVFDEAVLDGEE